jgi:ABC-type transport system involved in multi-copper enzyme maturation permease subunit
MGYELQQCFFSPFFYVICALFLFLLGVVFFVSLIVYADFRQEEPLMVQLFKAMGLPLLVVVPILTAKAIASEKMDRCFDALLLVPVSNLSIVWAKFFVIASIHGALWAIAVFFPEIVRCAVPSSAAFNALSSPQIGWGGWCFVNLVGGVAIAFGLLVSARAKTPATAVAMGVMGIFLWLVSGQFFRYIAALLPGQCELFSTLYGDWNVFFQLEDFCRGIFDTRVIVAYASAAVALLQVTAIALREN